MFEKKDVIYSEALGVCVVHDITKLTDERNITIPYYVLKNVFHKEKVSYIPVEGHQVVLRELISKEEAEAILKNAEETESLKDMDELQLGEVAYVLGKKPEDIVPSEEE